ncbi:MAG: NADH-quinone oxidoreductase subunit J [Novosphingobium sp.]|uniref:NADH-quinone oxidoreductase subunit J n=1 Tax=Novosphingobium sp. TaxID=1874826 RepID=UPI0032BC1673
MITALAFYLFASLTVLSGGATILARNPVHSVLWLICAFFNAAGLMILLGAEFIAMLLVIVYVGAVAVLFLFVVMMLNVDFAEMRAGFIKNFPLGLLLAAVLLGEIVIGLGAIGQGGITLGVADGSAAPVAGQSNIEAIGMLLYGKYLFLFEAAGIILLVALVGAIVLTHRKRGGVRAQSVPRQNARRPDEATVNVSPEVGAGVKL